MYKAADAQGKGRAGSGDGRVISIQPVKPWVWLRQLKSVFKVYRAECPLLEVTQPLRAVRLVATHPLSPPHQILSCAVPCGCWLQT